MKRPKQLMQSLTLILSASMGLMFSLSATALTPGDPLPPPIKLQVLTEGLESSSISLSLSMKGAPVKAIAKSCEACPGREFILDPETKYVHGESAIPLESVSSFSGQSGTVIYDPKTNVVQSIYFFKLED